MKVFIASSLLYLAFYLPGRYLAKRYSAHEKLIVSGYENLASTLIVVVDLVFGINYILGIETVTNTRTNIGEWLLSYFVLDLLLASTMTKVTLLHHIFGAILCFLILFDPTTNPRTYLKISLIEASTPFLNLRLFMKNFPSHPRLQKGVDLLFFLSFLAARTLFLPHLMWSEWSYLRTSLRDIVLFGGITSANMYWSVLLLKKFYGVIRGKKPDSQKDD